MNIGGVCLTLVLGLAWLCLWFGSADANAIHLGRDLYLGYRPWHYPVKVNASELPVGFNDCAHCHGPTGKGQTEGGQYAPPLDLSTLLHTTPIAPAYKNAKAVFRAIEQGVGRGDVMLNATMPRFKFTPTEKQALLDYLGKIGTVLDFPTGVSAESINVGTLLPLEGPKAAIGKAVQAGMQQRIDQANKLGGVHGRKIQLFVQALSSETSGLSNQVAKFIVQQHLYALLGSFAGVTLHDEQQVSQLLSARHIANIASLNVPQISSRLADSWNAPLLFSQAEQANDLESAQHKICLQALTTWVLVADSNKTEETHTDRITFDNPHILVTRLRQTFAEGKIGMPFRVLSLAGSEANTLLASELKQWVSNETTTKLRGCIGYLPLDAGALPAWPPKWQELMLLPIPDKVVAEAHSSKTSVWQVLGQISAQVLIEALAQAGTQLHERSLLEALPSLNGLEVLPNMRLSYRRDAMHGLEPTIYRGDADAN